MNIAGYFIQRKVTSWMVTLILLVGGSIAFTNLGQLEDPEFTIKDTLIVTLYPGASPEQVEEEVTYPIERELQNLPYVDKIKSTSKAGYSKVQITIKDKYRAQALKQIWDEVRKKIRDMSGTLPTGVQTPIVIDDFGDVYGVMLAIHGEGYPYKDLEDYVDYLKRELVLVNGVAKVEISAEQDEQVTIEVSRAKLATMGITTDQFKSLLANQNAVSNAGRVRVGSEYIRISPTGEFKDISELENLIVGTPVEGKLIRLSDIATIKREYVDPQEHYVSFNGSNSLLLGISFSSNVNVVEVGKRIDQRLDELKYQQPVGISMDSVYFQSKEVDRSVNDFLFNLVAAVGIVILVLLVFMGIYSGILIGLILLLTILGTFIVMNYFGINLQRISLGGLIIALGMLVDNAIVVTEGVLIGLKRGMTKFDAASSVVKQTKWPLLGATVIAVVAFAPIGLSPDSVGEFVGSLFYVLLISLLLSWVTAITLTPFFCDLFFKDSQKQDDESSSEDPYKGFLFVGYKWLLNIAMRFRWITVVLLIAALFTSGWAFQFVKQAFFPPSTTPMFYMNVWLPEGTHIDATKDKAEEIEAKLIKDERIEYVVSTVGQGAPRFLLTYSSEQPNSSYAQFIIRTHTQEEIPGLLKELYAQMNKEYPEIHVKFARLELGPSSGAKVEARVSGPDPEVLRNVSEKIKEIYHADGGLENIKDDWRQPVKVLRPLFDDVQARRLGISKAALDDVLLTNFSGKQVGTYRDGTDLLPIILTTPHDEHTSTAQIRDMQIYSPSSGSYVRLATLVSGFETVWEDPIIERRDRKRTITIMSDPLILGDETAMSVFNRIRGPIEAIELPIGYKLEWGGEYESSSDAQANIFSALPMGYLFMFIITILLFNSIRIPLVIWFCVPLALIGVSSGLLVMNTAFSFMALLGFLSLSGMIVKNGIVLADQISYEREQGTEVYEAIFISAVSRVRPVCMAAITTILGMIPLLSDAFFEGMAVVISFGLGFATILTLIAVPVFYAILFRVKYRKRSEFETP
ncbi:AcrB/AcrD/AcrF family protein [Marinomonas mediterranea]|uniref:Acriflavin resistance protein n=1 Tax=Marinomonas mediterranea (strain ATCC 700492 / JCM 21426 / NBRC 103028 / MMB-1) TaxID=717774 RepID=F2JTN9_MARM1|nr:efflux RND transporter permease subunit [Marinomonas mediterranea]ADZ92659.1 acriflavin resistance protein [Marinomonas mediterranea MMB-1]WCN14647.1 AcrB/AcrD/AcrF family protein [Marinomonas mediterranea]WCN18692.1 AcrB/AcrD/AcrF family protein [Marinomonas mediterranea MMB-1]